MIKLYKSMLTGILALGVASTAFADPYSLVVNVNDPSLVTFSLNNEEVELQQGENRFENLEGWISARADSKTEAVFSEYTYTDNYTGEIKTDVWATSVYVSMAEGDIKEYKCDLTAVLREEVATAKFTLNADDPSMFSATIGGKIYSSLNDLQAGENTIAYIPEAQSYLTMQSNTYGKPLYEVTVNGEKKQAQGSYYEITLEDGMALVVKAKFPEENAPVTLAFANEGKDALTGVSVDGNPVADFANGFEASLGSKIDMAFNVNDYKINEFKINDEVISYVYGSYSFFLTEAAAITLDATKYASFNCTIDVNNAAAVNVWKGYANSGQKYELADGSNTVEVSENNSAISVTAVDGYVIDEVLFNDEPVVKSQYSTDYSISSVKEGDVIKITASELVRDQHVAVYIQDREKWSDFSIMDTRYYPLSNDITEGYNVFTAAVSELDPIYISGYSMGADYSKVEVYLNDEKLQGSEYGFNYSFKVVNSDVVKVYIEGAPAKCDVAFEVAEDAGDFVATHDIVAEFNPADGLSCFEGTEVSITPAEGNAIIVSVNDENLTADSETKAFVFTVKGNDTVKISKDPNVGINSINADKEGLEIYNLQGIRVTNTENMPAGIYIVNGKKVVIK